MDTYYPPELRLLPPLGRSLGANGSDASDDEEEEEEEEEEEMGEYNNKFVINNNKNDCDCISANDSTQTEILNEISLQEFNHAIKADNIISNPNFLPQLQENGLKIDAQIERIEDAIEKLNKLTKKCQFDKFDYDIDDSQEGKSDNLHLIDPIKTSKKSTKSLKKRKRKSSFHKKLNVVNSNKLRKKKQTTNSSSKLTSPEVKIPTGSSPRDPIILRSGYPIVFDYENKDLPIRKEKVPHGPTKYWFKNGDCKIEFLDGTVRIKHKLTTYTYYPNGDKQLEFPDGANAYRYNSNGSVEFRCAGDHTLIYFFPNGQIEEHMSSGETKIRFPDRREFLISPDKKCTIKDRSTASLSPSTNKKKKKKKRVAKNKEIQPENFQENIKCEANVKHETTLTTETNVSLQTIDSENESNQKK